MEGVAEEEEVDDQLLWNLQILSEVCMIVYFIFFLTCIRLLLFTVILGSCTIATFFDDRPKHATVDHVHLRLYSNNACQF